MSDLQQRFTNIQTKLDTHNAHHHANACLLAVSKTKPADDIRTLFGLGQRAFGENYLQECLAKQAQLSDLDIEWHYIGHIQRNKTRDLARHFDWVQTLDRAIIAQRLNEQRAGLPPLNVLIQINVDAEDSKSGCQMNEVDELLALILTLPNLVLRGLMIIPAKEGTDAFARTKDLFDGIKTKYNPPHWDTLSMGMSGDMADAIANGSTMVRVGSAIFGEREYR
ncbi:YggS family pyridoxal phosphate-dependent enzyme [Moraxella oblonga]|uniref:YggS family pyridoxal phosphate-dependent enzyme n=1 Tax=Moraxella oblonga TaxID=200413 RepID=UPI00082D3BBA|nr:YggS family pyridoxal phosphate-dependent enzyme [Moraxella oblonga]